LNVTVRAELAPRTALQGLVVPEHVEELRLFAPLQPANVDPDAAVAVYVTVAALSEVVMFGEHVLMTVCDATAVPVPPHETGALTVPMLGVIVTEPVPVPANVNTMFRASVNVVCARDRESCAVR
jgi:hypothetical protein